MTTHGKTSSILLFGSILTFAGMLFAQNTADRPLFVNGKASGTVVQIDGRSYVDIDTVAQIMNGSVTIEPNRILLTVSATGSLASANATPPPPPPGLSRGFSSAAIALLAEMREWRGAIGTVLTYNVPVVGTWPQDYRDRVNASLLQVALGATTSEDQDAMQLLRNEFSNIDQWANSVTSTRSSLDATNTVSPNAVQNDQMLAKVSDCARFLGSMLVSGAFSDNASCH